MSLSVKEAFHKVTDKRAFHGETVQAGAIAPDVSSELVSDAIESRFCMETFRETLAQEAEIWAELVTALKAVAV